MSRLIARRAPGLRAAREGRGLTRAQLAACTGIAESQIAALEGGWGRARSEDVPLVLRALDAPCPEIVFRTAYRDRFGREITASHDDDCAVCATAR